MRLVSWNVNGLRSVWRQGFLDWLEADRPDIVCLQETKAQVGQLAPEQRLPPGYVSEFHSAEKPGYSGVAIYTREKPLAVRFGMGDPQFDQEGRVLIAEFADFVLINSYFPNSQRDHARLKFKIDFCSAFLNFVEKEKRRGKAVLVCGDFNIAHRPIDLKNPRTNVNNAGFLPEERAWMDRLVHHGWVDSFRQFCQEPDHYTWWSYRPGVRARNIGWRLDYFFVNAEAVPRLSAVSHQTHIMGSDHCPVVLHLDEMGQL